MISLGGDPRSRTVLAGSGLGVGDDWRVALEAALDGALGPLMGHAPDLLVLFAGAAYDESYGGILAQAAARSGAREVVGCSASGVIAGERELEDEPGVAVLALRLPAGSLLRVQHVLPVDLEEPVDWPERLGLAANACTGLILLADPFTTDVAALIGGLERDYPGATIVGGMATGAPGVQRTFVFYGRSVAAGGAVVIALGGAATLRPVVSQGCEPIGDAWTITDVAGHIVKAIGGRPAYQVLAETIQALDTPHRQRANGNLLVGLAMDEYRDEFKRGDFLIRNLMGVDRTSGAIAVAGEPRIGQTLQFQIRDSRAADEELRHMLTTEQSRPSAAVLLFACNGRGTGLFGAPDHDARTVRELLGPLPLAGLFCNGEIGPVGAATYIHGFTASLALIAASS
ncbi:MAG TPA: FIST N-terminal domain-containing protein [Chloroflexota bacterium]|nr:FIST N-terminal domain-containing protein [Chloroflexota bacterium]